MTARSALARMGKMVAEDIAAGGPDEACHQAIQSIEDAPESALDLIELLLKEGGKDLPDNDLVTAYAFLFAHALEFLRFRTENGQAAAEALVAEVRTALLEAGETGRASSPLLLIALSQFVSAKLDLGDDLRALMQRLIEADAENHDAAAGFDDVSEHLTDIAKELDGDPFAIHAHLAEIAETLPEELGAGLAMTAMAEAEPALREAVPGWLLGGSSLVRRAAGELIESGAAHGKVSGTMLRRMIALRNWLPADDRPALDRAIKACRRKGVACTAWPRLKVRELLVSGFDGSGAQSLFAIVAEGRKRALAALLVKRGIGVRDAWVRHGLSAAEVRETLSTLAGQVEIAPTTLDYVSVAARHFLAVNAESGVMPPFGLVDFAETTGLADLNPEPRSLESLVAALCSEIEPKQLSLTGVGETLADSAERANAQGAVDGWYEDGDAIEALLLGRGLSLEEAKAALLAGPLQENRLRWAELAAWTALTLKHRPEGTDWSGLAITARELLGDRPVSEIPLMQHIAFLTLLVHSDFDPDTAFARYGT